MKSLSRDPRRKGVIQITLGRAPADRLIVTFARAAQNPPNPAAKASIRPLVAACAGYGRCKSLQMRLIPMASPDCFGNPHALQFQ